MSKLAVAFTVGAVLFSSIGQSLEHYIVMEDPQHLQHDRPQVEQLVCGECISYNDNTKVCANYGGNLKMGWNWYQEWNRDSTIVDVNKGWYLLALNLYSQQGGGLAALLSSDKLFYGNFQGSIQSFKAKINLQVKYFYESHRTCITGYYDMDDFVATLKLTLSFLQCNKGLMNSLWNLDNWFGRDALWIDYCGMSSQETINLYEYENQVVESSKYFIGDEDPTVKCLPGFLWTTYPFGAVMDQVQNNLIQYVQQKLMPLKENGSWE